MTGRSTARMVGMAVALALTATQVVAGSGMPAEALYARRAEGARGLLRACADDPPRDDFLVEDRYHAEEARTLLKTLP